MSTANIVGHTAQLRDLEIDRQSGNIAHAYLFSGPPHLGKMTVAKYVAGRLLTGGNMEPAVQHQLDRLLHPDLLVLDRLWIEDVQEDWKVIARFSNVPQLHRSKTPKARTDTISIDDVRALQDRLCETGISGRTCCIIRSVERMHTEAVNALLKILEEPPRGVVFLLTTERCATLLPTLVSRCRTVHFHPLSATLLQSLMSDLSPEDRQFTLRIAQGAPGIACLLRDDPDALRSHKLCHERMLSFWRSSSGKERLQLLRPLKQRAAEATEALLHIGLTLREQPEAVKAACTASFHELVTALETNANRTLLMQRFVLQIMAKTA